MKRALIFAFASGIAIAAGAAQADNARNISEPVRIAANDTDKRVVVHKKNETVRRTVNEKPNGNVVRRSVTERPNGNTAVRRTVTERPNGNRVVRKAVRAPRRFRAARAWIAPRGFTYRRFSLGERIPSLLLAATYFLSDYTLYGLEPPPPGYVWVRDGTDAVLVDRYTGEVVQVQYDIFY